ncbi:Protein of unknown function [Bacillus wiedmannii]|nr:Protein of unknown function [Bacillus wiedmannii]
MVLGILLGIVAAVIIANLAFMKY